MRYYTHPHAPIDVVDYTSVQRVSNLQVPLHRPLFFLQAARGRTEPYWASAYEAAREFGEETFNKFGKYYDNNQFFMESSVYPYQACWHIRLPDPNAKKSTCVLELYLTEAEVVQYKRDSKGGYVYDEDNKPIPMLDGSNQIIKAPGYTFKITTRLLDNLTERFDKIKMRTIDNGGTITNIYPLICFEAFHEGVDYNKTGFKIYYDNWDQDLELFSKNKCLMYMLKPVQHINDSSIATPVRDIFDSIAMNFAAKPNMQDERVQLQLSFDDKVTNNYYEIDHLNDRVSLLPYKMHLYSENFKEIGDFVVGTEPMSSSVPDGWAVDILTGLDLDGNPYHTVEYVNDATTVRCSDGYTIYLDGGSDGDISQAAFEERLRAYLTGDVYPEIQDNFRYDFTHIYDTGFTYETKVAIAMFMALRDDFKPVLSSQDCTMDPNTREEDYSSGYAVRAKAILVPESLLEGTPCCRAEVYNHCAYSTDMAYRNKLPTTIWACKRRSETQNSTRMKRTLGGAPSSVVDMLRDLNYTEYDPKIKQIKFDNGLNYIQYKNRLDVFFPDLRSAYVNNTSILSSATYTDAVIYLKYIVRNVWTDFTGSERKPQELFVSVQEAITNKANLAFGGLFNVLIEVTQTDEMIANGGDEILVLGDLFGNMPMRKMTTKIRARKNTTASASNTKA